MWTLRMAALMGAGTFAVHQLRYALSYGHEVGGHGYLVPVGAVLVAALLLASAALLGRVARRAEERAPRFGRLWAATSVALVGVYTVQESLESILSGRVPGVFDHGGLVTLPLAAVIGLVIALLMRGAAAATRLSSARAPWRLPAAETPLRAVASPWAPRPARPSARNLAARAPPVVA
jgi:hypothetical protein